MRGMFVLAVRFACSYAGVPGVVGLPQIQLSAATREDDERTHSPG
jgi:hypothetical protein